jgi:hydrogenase expression/formation protein HypC
MCLAIPAKIIRLIDDRLAEADCLGNNLRIDVGLVDAAPGDYVLVHAGCAIERIEPEVAEEILGLLQEIENA